MFFNLWFMCFVFEMCRKRNSNVSLLLKIKHITPTFTCEKNHKPVFIFLAALNGITIFGIYVFQFPFFEIFLFFIRAIPLMGTITPGHVKIVSTLNFLFMSYHFYYFWIPNVAQKYIFLINFYILLKKHYPNNYFLRFFHSFMWRNLIWCLTSFFAIFFV